MASACCTADGAGAGIGASDGGSTEPVVPAAVVTDLQAAFKLYSLAQYADQAEVFTVHSKYAGLVGGGGGWWLALVWGSPSLRFQNPVTRPWVD